MKKKNQQSTNKSISYEERHMDKVAHKLLDVLMKNYSKHENNFVPEILCILTDLKAYILAHMDCDEFHLITTADALRTRFIREVKRCSEAFGRDIKINFKKNPN